MEEQAHEKIVQNMPETSSMISSSVSSKREVSSETHHIEEIFSSPTPVKTKEPSRLKSKEDLVKLPERYMMLLDFFERTTTSLRLLSLRKRTPNFQNIRSQVEILTGRWSTIFSFHILVRKLLFTHIAQMKYILPEGVQIDKILIHDEKTKCMKPDMKIVLLLDVVKDHNEESVYVALSKLFTSRLREFCTTHPEDYDVPEAALPEPFGQKSISIKRDSISEDLLTSSETKILNSSHFPPSFESHFYQKTAAASEMEKTDISSPVKSTSADNEEINEGLDRLISLPASYSTVSTTSEVTPAKLLVASGTVLVGTPALSTPMRPISPTRSVLTCEDENKITGSQNGKQPTSSAKKSLDFYGMDDQDTSYVRKQSSVSVSDFALLIHRIFQSVNFCPITKEELVQKVIMNNLEFDDCRKIFKPASSICLGEVEMQMEGLEKLVPDWFCKKLARSGDLLYR
ncbi:hypothetical protein OROGR_032218 [Orobanche gracilis]